MILGRSDLGVIGKCRRLCTHADCPARRREDSAPATSRGLSGSRPRTVRGPRCRREHHRWYTSQWLVPKSTPTLSKIKWALNNVFWGLWMKPSIRSFLCCGKMVRVVEGGRCRIHGRNYQGSGVVTRLLAANWRHGCGRIPLSLAWWCCFPKSLDLFSDGL